MKFSPSLISQDPLVAAAEAVLNEAKFGPQSDANKLAQAKSWVKQYTQSLKDATAAKKDAETIAFWKKRLEGAMKDLADIQKKMNEGAELNEAVTRNDLRQKYSGAYLSALELDEYPKSYQKTALEFAKKNGLKNNEVAVVHDEGISHTDYVRLLATLEKEKIAYDIWDDSRNSGEEVCFFSLKESTVSEARINGFQANRAVVNAQENLARVKTSFLPTSILARTVAQDVGPGVKADFEKITKLLEQVENIWEGIYMEGSMAYDANINK